MRKIYGHDSVIQRLARALKAQKTSRAWIFYGMSGIGKTELAYRFSAFILAEKDCVAQDLNPDEIQDVYQMVQNGTHPDFFTINQDAVSIDDWRNMAGRLYRKPTLSHHRVLLINNAEKLNINVFNALLKLFEEPPQDTAIIMITSNLDIVPITVKSRCACLKFAPLSVQDIKMVLKDLNEEVSDDEIALANGSIGDAIRLKGVQIYEKYLSCIVSRNIAAFLSEYNANDDWWMIRKCISRHLSTLLNISLEITGGLSEAERGLTVSGNANEIAQTANEILQMLSQTDTLQLDHTTFLRWALQKVFALCR